MKFIEKTDNVEREYDVYYDREKLKEILDEIVKKTSYKTDGNFTAPHGATFNGNEFTKGASLPNGDPMYENIKKIYYYTSSGPYSYHNDSIAVEGTQVTSPELAYIIEKILADEPESINEFFGYFFHPELVPIDEKIKKLNNEIDEIDNFDFDRKINALNNLKCLCEEKRVKAYFDPDLLRKYYTQAYLLFELRLVNEKTKINGSRILLKDYKTSK